MIERGDRFTVERVSAVAAGGQVLYTATHRFGVRNGPPVQPGDLVEVGNVCSGWCFLFVRGEKVRAQLLGEAPPSEGPA